MTRLRTAAFAALVAAGGCSFDSAEMGPLVVNTCSMAMECTSDAECMNGICIKQKADDPLTIALEVTPLRQPDGTEPLPILVAPFTVATPTKPTIELPEPRRLQGFVRSGTNLPIEADITFTPITTIRGIESKVITVASTPTRGSATAGPDFTVNLLNGRQYRMAVRPRDASLPPHYELVEGGAAEPYVEYIPEQLPSRRIVVRGATGNRTLRVRALSLDSGELISSVATLDEDGEGTLRFETMPEAFTVEIRAEATYTSSGSPPAVQTDRICDSNTPPYPVFTANSADLSEQNGVLHVELPALPMHTRFEGSVQLCKAGLEDGVTPDSLAISMHTADLLPEDSVLAAAFEASTTATYNGATQSLDFCVQVIPGQSYDVLATPASSVPCSLLSDKMRTVAAPAGEGSLNPVGLTLPEAAYLSATLRTMDNTPLRNVSIDAIALGGGGAARDKP